MTSLYSEAFQDFLRARLDINCSLPRKWHPSQPQAGLQERHIVGAGPEQVHCRLLQLPRELRDEIYRLVLGAHTTVHVSSETIPYHPPSDSGHESGGDKDEMVYTNDLYFDRCLESITEKQVYAQSLEDDPIDPFGSKPKMCKFQCGTCHRHNHCKELRGGRVFETAFLRTCRQVHREAVAVMCENYTFSFSLQHTLTTFIDQLTPLRRQALRSLHVSLTFQPEEDDWTWDCYDLMNALASLSGLRDLHISLKFLCRGNFQQQLQNLRDGSLALWKNELIYFRRPSLRHVTIVIEDLYPFDPLRIRLNSGLPLPDGPDGGLPVPWTKAQRAEYAEELRKKLLSSGDFSNSYVEIPTSISPFKSIGLVSSRNIATSRSVPLVERVERMGPPFTSANPMADRGLVLC